MDFISLAYDLWNLLIIDFLPVITVILAVYFIVVIARESQNTAIKATRKAISKIKLR
jgi:hypothetical protein